MRGFVILPWSLQDAGFHNLALDYDAQVGEALAGVKAMNKVIGLGMPVRQVTN